MDVLKLLVGLGLPSAIIAMTAIAFLFKGKYDNISRASLILAISLAALLGIYQIVALFSGRDVSIATSPMSFSAITLEGKILPAEISVTKGTKTVFRKTFAAWDSSSFAQRPLQVAQGDSNSLDIIYGPYGQGNLSFQVLREFGWRRATASEGDGVPRYWFTHKVFVGQKVDLGDTGDSGVLSIEFLKIKNNRAQVTLALQGRGKPMPRTVGILNKGLDAQDFEGLPTFYIAVREANFAEGWAAFSVFQYRGY